MADVNHVEVLERVHDDAGWTPRYLFMILMSAGIAVLGLLLSSPAVVIGAMLISPLMGPIIGLGFALSTADAPQIRRAAVALVAGSVAAILFCAVISLMSPLQNVTSEIAARTRPNLFDLLVALFSALAGAYATIKGRAGTIVGVAIATALMPPLATVGFGLATLNGTVFGGALLLFVTNFVTIAITAAVMARLYGFASALSPKQSWWQTAAIIVTFLMLAVPLGFSLRQIAWENLAGRQARTAVAAAFPDNARISQLEMNYEREPIGVSATVLTPEYRRDANRVAAREFARLVGRQATVNVVQYRVGVGDAEAAELQKAGESAAAARTVAVESERITDALSIAAGGGRDRITIDPEAHRAVVQAAPLPGATLDTYRALEARVGSVVRGWSVQIVPPALPLPAVQVVDDVPQLSGVIWAAQRRGAAVEVSGTNGEAVTEALAKAGVTATRGSERGALRVAWAQ